MSIGKESPDMSQPAAPEPTPAVPTPSQSDEFELLSTPPTAPDISGDLKARKGAGPSLVTLSLVGVVLAVGGFVGGVAGGQSHASSSSTSAAGAPSSTRSRGQFGGQNGAAGARAGGTVTGTVQKIDGSTITVVDATGKVTTVDTSDQTTVTVGKPGTVADLATGAQITVIGTPGSNGVITARSVLSGVSLTGLGGNRAPRTPTPSASPTTG
jgi:hypothetical protein